jgi:ABC-2 type transport system ATP-binding protein
MISVNEITKAYGDVIAVNNISFTIRTGEITGLLGPNGAGKTTTLRMLTGYLKPEKGSITVGDYNASDHPLEVKKIIGYLPESAPIYGDMLVYDYLAYIAEVRGISGTNRIKEIGALCGINEVMHKNVSELSKGYKQRVGLAHAMIHDPDILVLDEPTSGLDPNQIIEIRNLIKLIGKKKTIILSTHILSEVEATCDRVIIINKGSIVADDSTRNLQMSTKQGKTISLKLSGASFSDASDELKKINTVSRVAEVPSDDGLMSLTVSISGDREIRPDIFKLAGAKGWVLYEMRQDQLSLENVFRELTKGGDYANA